MIRLEQLKWTQTAGWRTARPPTSAQATDAAANLLLVFGGREAMTEPRPVAALRARFPGAILVGCSTAGEILDTQVCDEELVATAVAFSSTRVAHAAEADATPENSAEIGARLAGRLAAADLRHLLVLADGISVNGSELVRGLEKSLPAGVTISGGLAGDGARFERTAVRCEGELFPAGVVVVGFYGERLRVGCGSLGGWDPFGPERRITRSCGNVLFELDSRPALELYRLYLGEHAAGLPATGLRFPLSLRSGEAGRGLVRTMVGFDDSAGSLTFVGDIPQGQIARLMRANLDRLIDGAAGAATTALSGLQGAPAEVALLISCVGRRMILDQRVEEEVEAVREVLGPAPALTGFYSYGEIAPLGPEARSDLHNQTMTVTAFAEI
jgi:hypothetical protein